MLRPLLMAGGVGEEAMWRSQVGCAVSRPLAGYKEVLGWGFWSPWEVKAYKRKWGELCGNYYSPTICAASLVESIRRASIVCISDWFPTRPEAHSLFVYDCTSFVSITQGTQISCHTNSCLNLIVYTPTYTLLVSKAMRPSSVKNASTSILKAPNVM